MKVWVVEEGEYEQRAIVVIASSLEAAERAVKHEYGEPYVIRWERLREDPLGSYVLRGHFEAVQGFSTEHVADFDLEPYELAE